MITNILLTIYHWVLSHISIALYRTMEKLLSTKKRPCRRMIDICFSRVEISKPKPEISVDFVNKNLDKSQREAVTFALRQEEVAIIVGPPGTGQYVSELLSCLAHFSIFQNSWQIRMKSKKKSIV